MKPRRDNSGNYGARSGAHSGARSGGRAIGRFLNAGEAVGAEVTDPEAAMVADLVQDDETIILLLRPSPLYVVLGSLGSIATILIFTLLLAYLPGVAPWVGWTDAQAFTLGVGLLIARLCWQTLDWWSRVYVLTDRRMIRKIGVTRIVVFETALSKIQHTAVIVRLRERPFDLGTIGFATAGSDTYEAFWIMIPKPYQVHKIVLEAIDRYGRNRKP